MSDLPKNSGHSDKSCSFCGKRQDEVKKLIAGENAYICNECIDICIDLVQTPTTSTSGSWADRPLPKPKNCVVMVGEGLSHSMRPYTLG